MLFTEITEKPAKSLEQHLAEVNAWLDEDAPAYTGIDPVVRNRMGMAPATQGEIRDYLDANPTSVRSGSGAPVTTGTGNPVQSGGAVKTARAADAVSPDRDQSVAMPPGFRPPTTTPTPSVSAATTAPVVTKPITSTTLPSMTPAAKPKPTFSKDVTSLAAANKIADPNKINVGQSIKLPTGQNYTVAKGDTLSGISSGQFKGATTPPPATTTPPPSVVRVPPTTTTPPPAVKPPTTTTTPPPAVKPAAPAASAPVTPPPAVKPATPPASSTTLPPSKILKPTDIPGLGPNDIGPKKSPNSGRNPELQASNKAPINMTNTLGTSTTSTMFNQLPPGSFGGVKESGELARIKSLAGLK